MARWASLPVQTVNRKVTGAVLSVAAAVVAEAASVAAAWVAAVVAAGALWQAEMTRVKTTNNTNTAENFLLIVIFLFIK
jgi:hypothetical protein